MNIAWISRISTRMTLSIGLFLLVLIALITSLLVRGFSQTEAAVTDASRRGLETQGRAGLLNLAEREARLRAGEIEKAATASRQAAAAFADADRLGAAPPAAPKLTDGPQGNRFDADPNRGSDLVLFSGTPDGPAVERDLAQSRLLDFVFPGLLREYGNAAAIYYISADGLTRYYPPIGLQDIVPPDFAVLDQVFFTIASPAENPGRATAWTPPYVDPAAQGLLVTASSPVYVGDTFRGVVGVDLGLDELVEAVKAIKPTPGGYALLLDREGKLIAGPEAALRPFFAPPTGQATTLTATLGLPLRADNADLSRALEAMKSGQSGVGAVTLEGQSLFVAYAPLPHVAWSLLLVAPAGEVTAEAQAVTAAIRSGTGQTVSTTLLILGGLTILALLGTWLLSRRLTRPIVALVEGTRAVAAADFQVKLPVVSRDELGLLATSFNAMTARLVDAQRDVQVLNQNLERTVEQRTSELEQERASLQQALDELRAMSSTVARLSTPIIPVLRGVVVVPLIGSFDSGRIERVQAELLRSVQALAAHTVILDLTGLDRLDTETAGAFNQALASLRLLGARPLLVGVHPDLAENLVHSDIDLNGIATMRNLQAAVQHAIGRTNG